MEKSTLLYRQVNPNWLIDGRPTSQTFTPFPKDEGKLSAYNGKKWTAQDSFLHFTENQGFEAIGNLAVTPKECDESDLQTIEDNIPFDGHAYIDFTPFTTGQVRTKAKQLKNKALQRGFTYLPHNL